MAGARDPLGPTGATPQAKRPAVRDMSIPGQAQVHHTMTIEDLTSAFFALNGRLDREEAWATMIHKVVEENADLLTKAVAECANLARSIKANEEAAGAMAVKITSEARSAMEMIHETDRANDTALRNELDAMTRQLHANLAALETKLSAVAATAGVSGPDLPPGLDGMGEKIAAVEAVNATMAVRIGNCETSHSQLMHRVHASEQTLSVHEAAIKDAQSKIDTVQRRQVDSLSGARDPWAQTSGQPEPQGPETFNISGEERGFRAGGSGREW